jgi:hypothetical protein
MPDVAKTSNNLTSDVFQPVTEAMQNAMTTESNGAVSGSTNRQRQGVTQLLSQLSYCTGYYVAYGVVLPTLLLVKVVPGAHTLVSGFVDGATAAGEYVRSLGAESLARPTSMLSDQSQQVATAMA